MVGWANWVPAGSALFAALLASGVEGQHTFNWKFANNFILTELQECQTLPINVIPLDGNSPTALGVPPYYLIAFQPGGVPTTTMIGNNVSSLSWQVRHQRGSALMLTVVDSNTTGGMAGMGGMTNTFYNVTAGSSTDCLPTLDNSTLASLLPNVTDTLETCEPWGLTVKGGKKPYTIVLSALGAPVITNVTMGADDDVFTYVNRVDPNAEFMASVADAQGNWGVSSQVVRTKGSTDVTCPGRASSSKTSAEIAQEAEARKQAGDGKQAEEPATSHRRNLIIGITIGLGVPILLGIALGTWYYTRKRSDRDSDVLDNQDATPRPYVSGYVGTPDTNMREVDTVSSKRALTDDRPTSTPLHMVASSSAVGADVQPDIIIQHRDGGLGARVVQELPPPYADHPASGRL